jgi:hypothetical protein
MRQVNSPAVPGSLLLRAVGPLDSASPWTWYIGTARGSRIPGNSDHTVDSIHRRRTTRVGREWDREWRLVYRGNPHDPACLAGQGWAVQGRGTYLLSRDRRLRGRGHEPEHVEPIPGHSRARPRGLAPALRGGRVLPRGRCSGTRPFTSYGRDSTDGGPELCRGNMVPAVPRARQP